MRVLAATAAASAAGFLAGFAAVTIVLPPAIRRSGRYGSLAGRRRG